MEKYILIYEIIIYLLIYFQKAPPGGLLWRHTAQSIMSSSFICVQLKTQIIVALLSYTAETKKL